MGHFREGSDDSGDTDFNTRLVDMNYSYITENNLTELEGLRRTSKSKAVEGLFLGRLRSRTANPRIANPGA